MFTHGKHGHSMWKHSIIETAQPRVVIDMGKLAEKAQRLENKREKEIEGEIVSINDELRHDHIPHDVWQLIQENGRIAIERLNEILSSPKFNRLKATDQAKLIALATDRAYGRPDPGIKRVQKTHVVITDATATALSHAASRAELPEYKSSQPLASNSTQLGPEIPDES